MKKISSIICVLIFLYTGLDAQNVGINITAPIENLHVDSVIKIGKSLELAAGRKNLLKFGDGSYVTIGEEVLDDKLYIRFGDLVFLKSSQSLGSGFIGINTETPTATLDINGSMRLRGNGAALGRVLTTDANGVATWQVPPGITLPYSGSSNLNQDAFSITNSGNMGRAGFFYNTNDANEQPAVFGFSQATNGKAKGVHGRVASTTPTGIIAVGVLGDVTGDLTYGQGVKGYAKNATGVFGETETGIGVYGSAAVGTAVLGQATGTDGVGLYGVGRSGAIPLQLYNQAGGDIAYFRSGGALVNKARIDGTGKGFFNGGTQTSGADVAEAFAVEGSRNKYEPGDVLVISTQADRTVAKCSSPYSTLVVGVYATKPGVLLTERLEDETQDDLVPMGVIGVIPTKVTSDGGSIHRGDMLVTSNLSGHAMKGDKKKMQTGTVIGKALEDFTGPGTGLIKVLVNVR